MKRTGSMRSRVGPAVTTTLRPRSSPAVCDARRRKHGLDDFLRFDHAAGASLAAGLAAVGGTENRQPALAQRGDVRLRRGIGPHQSIHRGHDDDRHVGREAQRRQQVVRQAVRDPRNEIRGGRRDDDALRPACEFDVPHGRFGRGVPQVRAHGSARKRLERERSDELLRAGRHHDLHVGAAILESTRQFGALVGGNAARDAEHDAHRWSFRG